MRCDVGLRRRGWGLPWRIGSVPPKLGIVEAWCQTAPVMSGAEARTLEAWKLPYGGGCQRTIPSVSVGGAFVGQAHG